MKVYIIIPCYNEAEHLAEVVESVKPYGRPVVVDDGSRDSSFKTAREHGAIALKHIMNRGQGAALETGDIYASARFADAVVHFDADGQHQASDIPALLEPIAKFQADVVFGSRFLNKESGNKVPLIKKWLILRPATWAQNFLLKTNLTDAHNGLRALSAKALKRIRISQDNMAHASEIIEQVKKFDLKYAEVPVTVLYHKFGLGFGGGFRIIRDLLFGKLNKKS